MTDPICEQCGKVMAGSYERPREYVIGPVVILFPAWTQIEPYCAYCSDESHDNHDGCYSERDVHEAYEQGRDEARPEW